MPVPLSPAAQKLFSPAKIGSLELPNRLQRAGCFEGMCPDGLVSDTLIEHHRRLAQGGIGMTTVAYCSVSYDGRAYGHELWMRPEVLPGLRRLAEAVHAEGAAVSIQLGHCGFFSNPSVIGRRPLSASPRLCLFRLSVCAAMSEAEIAEKVADFARAAAMAKEAGLDAVEIHAGHGYLLSQFLSPWTNRRTDRYGGSLENRLRFPLAVLQAVRQAAGPGFPLLVKMNQLDGFPGGLGLDEAAEIARQFEAAGASALVPSGGFTARTPLFMLRGNVPTLEMARNQSDPLSRFGLILFGRFMVQQYKFRPMFLLEGARRIRAAVRIPVVYIGGVRSLAGLEAAAAEGFDFFQLGRATIRDSDFPRRLRSGEVTASDCDQCNRCIAAMDAGGLHCVTAKKDNEKKQ